MKRLLLPIVFLFLGFISLISPSRASAIWYKYPQNPVVGLGLPGQFDSNHTASPSVIYNNGQFQMWYDGENGANWRTGYATSNDGVEWIRHGEITIDLSGDPEGQNRYDVNVIYDNGIYKMWYAASPDASFNMHINYAESTDGVDWVNSVINVLTPSLPWEQHRGVSAPSIIHDNDGYKMWYGANGIVNGFEKWQIGYATSPDGFTWVKNSDPVLSPSDSWEGNAVSGPTVIFNGSQYEMWYHSGEYIGHAISSDGVAWIKDVDNPVLTPSQTFDVSRVLNAIVLKQNEVYKMWYGGVNSSGHWQIGYAQTESFDAPTPTPTSTPTPTPTLSGPYPVVLIPGMGAGWNQNDMFACSLSDSGDWTLAPYAEPFYRRLIKTFTENVGLQLNQDFFVYGYDWRQSMVNAGDKLKDYLNSLSVERVNIVSHSLGGLVARSYIQQNLDSHKVGKLVTLGTPHQGTVLAYPLWENGEVWSSDLIYKVGINTLMNICRVRNGFPLKTKREIVQLLSPSVRDILPAFDFIYKNNLLVTDDLIEGENPWLLGNPFSSPFNNTDLLTISGGGHNTIESLKVNNARPRDLLLSNWLDGDPFYRQMISAGDGTVLSSSSLVEEADQETFATDHIGLIKDVGPIQAVLDFLGYSGISPASQEVVLPISQSTLIIASDKPVDMELLNSQGATLQDNKEGILTEFSDKAGRYKLKLKPDISGIITLTVGQIGITESWKDYKVIVKQGEVMNFSIIYNPQKPSKNPLVNL